MHLIRPLLILTSLMLSASVAAQEGGFYVYQPKNQLSVLVASCPGLKPPERGKSSKVECTFTDTTVKVRECDKIKECSAPGRSTLPPGVLVFEKFMGGDMAAGCCRVYDPSCPCYRWRCPC